MNQHTSAGGALRFAHLTGLPHLLRCGTSVLILMKKNTIFPILLVLAIAVGCSLGPAPAAHAQDGAAGIQQAMTPEEFRAAGLEKLTPAELEKLNAWIQGDRAKAVKVAEKKVNERAAREKTNLIVSRVDGIWNGIAPGMVIQLEDGSKWKLANRDEHYGGRADHPAVAVWKAGMFGWKMRVSQIAEFYVLSVK